jgi:cyclic beta-1,2-glucan synthetase
MWPTYTIDWRLGQTLYRITVMNPEHRCRGVQSAELDGVPIDARAIPLLHDGQTHHVVVTLGRRQAASVSAPVATIAVPHET